VRGVNLDHFEPGAQPPASRRAKEVHDAANLRPAQFKRRRFDVEKWDGTWCDVRHPPSLSGMNTRLFPMAHACSPYALVRE